MISSIVKKALVCAGGATAVAILATVVVLDRNMPTLPDLLGQWCGDEANLEFTPTTLTVSWLHGAKRVVDVERYEVGYGTIDVRMKRRLPDGSPTNTIFKDFSFDHTVMYQAANTSGDHGPRRRFRRCT
jgi:hypothetical protein